MNIDSPKASQGSQTLMRGLHIIEAVSNGKRVMPEISEVTGIAFSTAYRLASSLVAMGYLRFEPRRGYFLGRKLMELGFAAYRESDLRQIARPFLESLAKQTGDTVHLAVLEDEAVVYLDKINGSRPVEVSSKIGGRKPICSTGVGKSLVLTQGSGKWREHFKREYRGNNLELDLNGWLALMEEYSSTGFSLDLGEDDLSIRCVAAPVFDGNMSVVAAISVTSTVEYTDKRRLLTLAPEVQKVAQEISRGLGARFSQG